MSFSIRRDMQLRLQTLSPIPNVAKGCVTKFEPIDSVFTMDTNAPIEASTPAKPNHL
jgi:hypothetical protein